MYTFVPQYKYFHYKNYQEVSIMAQLSEKELSSIQELLADEDLLVKKFQMLAEHASDAQVKSKMLEISEKHQSHLNELYSKLS